MKDMAVSNWYNFRTHKALSFLVFCSFILYAILSYCIIQASKGYVQEGCWLRGHSIQSSDQDEHKDRYQESHKDTRNPTASCKNPELDRYNRQQKRQKRLRQYCKNTTSLNTIGLNLKKMDILYSDKAGVVYCLVPKAACTNWRRIMRVFNGKAKTPMEVGAKQKVHGLSYPTFYKSNETRKNEWRKNFYYSFMFVRHPFERVLSAYRNKLVDPYDNYYQRMLGSKILRKYRKGLTEGEYKQGKNVTFQEFVNWIIFSYKKYGPKNLNPHWGIYHHLCSPCSMKYNFIGKMETLVEDAGDIIKQIGWDKKLTFPANATDKYAKRTKEIMKEYYGTLQRFYR